MLHLLFSAVVCSGVSFLWAYAATRIARSIERRECETDPGFSWMTVGVSWLLASLAGAFLPVPMNLAVALALAGLVPAAWSDWRTTYLWDEIILSTGAFAAGAMILGGHGWEALSGAGIAGGIAWMMWFAGKISGRESGFGDVKMCAVIGIALGPLGGVAAFFVATYVGIGIWALLRKRLGTEIPYGPALAAGLVMMAGVTPWLNTTFWAVVPPWFAVQP